MSSEHTVSSSRRRLASPAREGAYTEGPGPVGAGPAGSFRAPRASSASWMAGLRQRWQVISSRWTPPRRIRPTRVGVGFLVLAFAIGFAALNTGNNLLYLVLGMMLSLIAVSGVISELSVLQLGVERRVPAELRAGERTPVTLVLHNRKRTFPALGVWLEEGTVGQVDADPAFGVFVAPRAELSLATSYVFARRGRVQLRAVRVATTFPFGLFSRSYVLPLPAEVLVLPKVEPVRPLEGHPFGSQGETASRRRGTGDEFFGLRSFVDGDDPRRIHWKTSARRGLLLLRETLEPNQRRIQVVMELASPLPEEAVYEAGVVLAVSHAAHFLEQGYQVAFEMPGVSVGQGEGALQLRRILRHAALAPRAAEAAEMPARAAPTGPGRRLSVRVGQGISLEATG